MDINSYDAIVAQDGSGDFVTITEALQAAPNNDQLHRIYICKGVYYERLSITRDKLVLVGEDRDTTVITSAVCGGHINSQGGLHCTAGSRTVLLDALDCKVCSLTIKNEFDYLANELKVADDPEKMIHTQAVALLVGDMADRTQFHNVNLISYQDTLFLRGGRSVFSQSRISGTVDFIFGPGVGLFTECDIVARYQHNLDQGKAMGYITAPATSIHQKYGLIFKHCRLIKEPQVPAKSYALGRPWHPTTAFHDGNYADPNAIGQAVFMHCDLDDHIYGWDKMHGKDVAQNRIYFHPEDSRFYEYGNHGMGSLYDVEDYRPQLVESQNQFYEDRHILQGWLFES